MATIRKRKWLSPTGEERQAWQVDYRDAAGRRRSKQFDRKRDAEAWSTKAGWEVSQGTHTPDSQSVTVAKAADLWLARAEREGLERTTITRYREIAELHIKPHLGGERLSRLSRPLIERFRDTLVETRTKALAARAVRNLSSILAEAQRRGLVAQNVAREVRVRRPSREQEKVEILSSDEIKALLAHVDDDRRALLLVALFTGLRSSELRGLRWVDVDLGAATVTVEQRADRYATIGSPKSAAGHRTIPLAPIVVSALKRWKLKCPKGEAGLVFPNGAGNPENGANLLNRFFKPLQLAAGVCNAKPVEKGEPILVARYGLHALRHTCASLWIKQGVDLKRLQRWLGHSTITLTLDRYGHLIKDASSDAAVMAAMEASVLA